MENLGNEVSPSGMLAEQVAEMEKVDEAIQTEYALTSDGTIVKQEG